MFAMTIPLLLTLLSGCNLLGETQVKWWGGWSTQSDMDGVQMGTAAEILVRQDYVAREHRVLEETWRFDDDGLQQSEWIVLVQGSTIESQIDDDPGGTVVITGTMLAGEPYDWTSWHWVWSWIDGDRAGDYVIIDGSIGEDASGHWLHMDKQFFGLNDVPVYTQSEDLLEHSEEDWNTLQADLGN